MDALGFSRKFIHKSILLLLLWPIHMMAQAPAGYYDGALGLSGQSLQIALHDIIDNHTVLSYDNLWVAFQSTDDKANGKVWDMYSDVPDGTPSYEFTFISDQCGNYSNEGDCYNREHSFPKSWFNDASPMYTDLFHLVPTDGKVNGMRSNYPFGEVGSASWTSTNGSKLGASDFLGYSGIVFEPIDAYKGDFARTYFYMATRYQDVIAGWEKNDSNGDAILDGTSYPVFESWFLTMLMRWHEADPVSQKEIDRNNEIYYTYQHNRNPYIDHPEYVNLIWGDGIVPEPSNHVTNFSAHTISLSWTDATGGTLPDGYLVRMSAISYEDILAPEDGTAVADDASNRNVAYGLQKCVFGGLTPGEVYFFKLYAYKGSGATIDYKTDGVPQTSEIAK